MLKTATRKVVEFIPNKEKGSDKPTTIFYRPMSKAEHDAFLDSLTNFNRRGKLESKMDKRFELLLRKQLEKNEAGHYVLNAIIDGKEFATIDDKEQAIQFLTGLEDIETADEIESAIRGASTLTEDEEKN